MVIRVSCVRRQNAKEQHFGSVKSGSNLICFVRGQSLKHELSYQIWILMNAETNLFLVGRYFWAIFHFLSFVIVAVSRTFFFFSSACYPNRSLVVTHHLHQFNAIRIILEYLSGFQIHRYVNWIGSHLV